MQWLKQNPREPLFPNIEWSKPENKQQAGRLLIIGGNAHAFADPAQAYQIAKKAGIGTCKVVLPISIRKLLNEPLVDGEFAASTPSGSFSQKALEELLAFSSWADGVLLAGNLGRNSETAIMLEHYLRSYNGPVVLTRDAADYLLENTRPIEQRPHTLLVLSFAQLQKIALKFGHSTAFTFNMGLQTVALELAALSERSELIYIIKHHDFIHVAVNGQVSTTQIKGGEVWRVRMAALASVYWLQHMAKPFEALTTAVTKLED
jgi:hypothetical protein